VAALLVVVLFLGMAMAWFALDRTPPSWDDAYYLTKSLELYDTLTDRGVVAYARKFLTVMDGKPPLIAALPTPIYLVAGRRHRAAYGVNLLFLAILFAAVYGIARTYGGSRAALIAVAAVGTIPAIYGLAHWYLVECGLIALVSVAIYLLAGWSESSGAARAGVLGIVFGFGLLMKASFPLYVVVPLGYILWRWRKTALQLKPVAAFVIGSLVIAGPWYLMNARAVVRTALQAGSAETARIYETGAAFSASAMGHYLFDVANAAPWLYVAAIPVLALAGWRLLKTKRGLLLVLLWISPLIFLAAGHYRDLRYAAPLYPAVALLFAWMADAATLRRGLMVTVGVCAVLGLGWLSMIQNSFDWPGNRLELGGLLLNAPRFSYARAFDHAWWPQREILTDIYRSSKASGGQQIQELLGTNSLRFNADNFTLAAREGRLPLEIETTAYLSDATRIAEALNRAPYFIYKEGGERDQSNFNTQRDAAIQQARAGGRFAELPMSRALPDGGVVHVLANTSAGKPAESSGAFLSVGLSEIPECKVTFADGIELSGIGVARTAAGIEVSYRWRCVRPMSRNYWCFTHVVDGAGKVIGYLDHRILNGNPPTPAWKAGDVAVEKMVFPLAEKDSGAYQLRIGVFDRESGERLAIVDTTLPVILQRTAVVVEAGRRNQ